MVFQIYLTLLSIKINLYIISLTTIIPLVIIAGSTGMIVFAVGVILTLFLVGISTRSFGGITGDVLGASNELTRLSSLLIFVTL